MLATRAYALLFALTLLTAAAVEFVPRGEPSRMRTRALRERIARNENTLRSIEARVGRGELEESDAAAVAALRGESDVLRREATIRTVRSGAFVVLALGSVLFALVTLPRVLFAKRPPPRAGDVEVEPDEDFEIDPVESAYELGKLQPTRQGAIDMLLNQVSLHCSHCMTLWRPEVLGRIGKRVLVQRTSPGVTATRNVLGEGWWARPANPPPCAKCGGNDLVPD